MPLMFKSKNLKYKLLLKNIFINYKLIPVEKLTLININKNSLKIPMRCALKGALHNDTKYVHIIRKNICNTNIQI